MREISPWLENIKTKVIELMSIVGMELESKRVEMVKLKSKKEELMVKLGQMWGNFLSFYSQFYEVTILENTYATGEGKMQVYL